MKKKIISILLATTLIATYSMPVFAEENDEFNVCDSDGYLENHYVISVDNIEISEDSDELVLEPKDDLTKSEKKDVNEDIEELEILIDRYDEQFEEIIVEDLGDLDAEGGEKGEIIITECPLQINEQGELDRIKEDKGIFGLNLLKSASAATHKESRAYFTLTSTVTRSKDTDANGKYTYTCKSYALWDKDGYHMVGGANHPGAGNDYIFQTVPRPFKRVNNSYSLSFNYDNFTPKAADVSSLVDAGDNYLCYSIKDKDSAANRLVDCTLQCKWKAKKGTGRSMYTYYYHSWKKMNVEISVKASTDKLVTLNITPSIKSGYWKLTCPVDFDL